MLSIDEAIDAIADEAFADAREFPTYQHDGAASLQAHLRCFPQYADAVITPQDLTTADAEAESATASQWARVLAIRSALPDAAVTLRVHQLSWKRDSQAPSLSLFGVLAVSKIGPLILRCEFTIEG